MMHSAFAGWAGWRFASVHPFCRVAILGGLKPTLRYVRSLLQGCAAQSVELPVERGQLIATAAATVGWASAHRFGCPTLPAWRYAR